MVGTAEPIDSARELLSFVVERERRRTGSKTRAYEVVSAAIGRSRSWVEKIIGRQRGPGLSHETMLAIVAKYHAICERIEADAEHDRRLAAALRGHAHAAIAGALDTDVRALGADLGPSSPLDEGSVK